MTKKYFKIVIALISCLILLLCLKIALIKSDLYPYKLTDEYYLVGVGNDKFEIKDDLFGTPIITNISNNAEWIITANEVYGCKGNPNSIDEDYFFLERKSNAIAVFDDLGSLNNFLKEKGLNEFSMIDSEKIAHLRIDRRKF